MDRAMQRPTIEVRSSHSSRTPVYNLDKPVTPDQKGGSSVLQDEVYIKIRPRRLLKGALVVGVLFLFFFLGRWSVEAPGLHLFSDLTVTSGEDKVAVSLGSDKNVDAAVAQAKEIATATPKSSTAAVVTESSKQGLKKESVKAGTSDSSISAASNASPPDADLIDEKVVTTYSKVAVSVGSVKVDWKETWGKIIQLQYTIKNNEEGTIKPSYFMMLVENYEDVPKKILLPLSHQKVAAGQMVSGAVNVPQGFAYSESTAGKLDSVRITVTLVDAAGKTMSGYTKEYNLAGSK